jgi:hypothetical protein
MDAATAAEWHDLGPAILARSSQDSLAELRPGLGPLARMRELGGTVTQRGHLLPAVLAGVEVPLVRPPVLGIQRVQRVRGGQVVELGGQNG